VTTVESDLISMLAVGRSYDLIGLEFRRGRRRAVDWRRRGEAELRALSFFFFFLFWTRPLWMQEQMNLQDWA
jgi:hypothetical protein